jgi:hypothetical protein
MHTYPITPKIAGKSVCVIEPRRRVILEKLIVVQLSKVFPSCMEAESSWLCSEENTARPNCEQAQSILAMLSSHPRQCSSSYILPSVFLTKILDAFYFPCSCLTPWPKQPSFDQQNSMVKYANYEDPLYVIFLHPAVASSVLGSCCFLRAKCKYVRVCVCVGGGRGGSTLVRSVCPLCRFNTTLCVSLFRRSPGLTPEM